MQLTRSTWVAQRSGDRGDYGKTEIRVTKRNRSPGDSANTEFRVNSGTQSFG